MGAVTVNEKEDDVEDGEGKEFNSGSMLTFYHADPVLGSVLGCEGKQGWQTRELGNRRSADNAIGQRRLHHSS